jgi:hypothetical protein
MKIHLFFILLILLIPIGSFGINTDLGDPADFSGLIMTEKFQTKVNELGDVRLSREVNPPGEMSSRKSPQSLPELLSTILLGITMIILANLARRIFQKNE